MQRNGVATTAAARPNAWLMLLAISSLRDWSHSGAANNSSIAFMRLSERASPSHNTVGFQVKAENNNDPARSAITTIFFDAAGTLIYLPKSVGHHYAFVAERIGLRLEAGALDAAFADCWKQMPARPAIDGPREDDDKGWWRELVNLVLDQVAADLNELDRDGYFEAVYGHFAEPGVWDLFPEAVEVLEALHSR